MIKELNIIEASNMPIGTEFEVIYQYGRKDDSKCIVEKGTNLNILAWIHNGLSIGGTQELINAKFIPIQKPVEFMEVVKSDKYCRVEHELIEYADNFREGVYYPFDWVLYCLSSLLTLEKLRKIILEGNWYIKE